MQEGEDAVNLVEFLEIGIFKFLKRGFIRGLLESSKLHPYFEVLRQ